MNEKLHKEDELFLQNIDKIKELKKMVLDTRTSFNQQILFCVVTILAVIVSLNKDIEFQENRGLYVSYLICLLSLLLSTLCSTILLYAPFRLMRQLSTEFLDALQHKSQGKSSLALASVGETTIEKFCEKIHLFLFCFSVLTVFVFGILSTILPGTSSCNCH